MKKQSRFRLLIFGLLFSHGLFEVAMASPPATSLAKGAIGSRKKTTGRTALAATQKAYDAVMQQSFLEKHAYDLLLLPNGHWAVRSRNYVRHPLSPRPPPGEFVSLKAPELRRWISYLPTGSDLWYSPAYNSTVTKKFFISDPKDPEYGLVDLFRVCQHYGHGVRLIINMIRA